MKTVALDQNKWIEIAIAWATQDVGSSARKTLEQLVDLTKIGQARFPLTYSNIYETQKITDPRRRAKLAYVQAVMSGGKVFVGHGEQRQKEILDLLRAYFNLPLDDEGRDWFLSNRFWEAVAPTDTLSETISFPAGLVDLVEKKPVEALFSYLTDIDESTRSYAVQRYSAGMNEVLTKIEGRREHHRQDSLSIRRKALGVYMFMDNQDQYWKAVNDLGLSTEQFKMSDDSLKRDLVRSVPCLDIERELVLKIEAETTKLVENDLRDLQFFATTLPYADVVVAEKPFTQRVRQAGLHKKYSTFITSNLSDLLRLISDDCSS